MANPKVEEAAKAPVTLVVSSASGLRDKLTRLLERIHVDVDSVTVGEDLQRIVNEGHGRVLLIDRAQLPEDPADFMEQLLCQDDAPALVVVADAENAPYDRAHLLAAGATGVVDPELTETGMVKALEAVASNKASGIVDGPEIRGNAAQPQLSDFISRSNSMQRFIKSVERVADVNCSLLVTGETGVGKERLARAIHAAGSRKGRFVGVNCGALPETLLESQLFGHKAGAFTGANSRHRGFFEQASGGTIFLDEVGEIPLHLQVKLLTVLQRHEVQPLGSEEPVTVDPRVIAATNRDLREEVRQGRFREDLFYRLNVIHLRIPPLRNRVEDIPELVGRLIQFFRCDLVQTRVQTISESALDALMDYGWPGNIRELINVIERSMILSDGPKLEIEDLPSDIRWQLPIAEIVPVRPPGSETEVDWSGISLKEAREAAAARAERAYLDHALRLHGGRLEDVARQAKIGTRSLYDKMQRYGLKKERYRGRLEDTREAGE